MQDTNKQQNGPVYFFTRWSELKKKAHKVVRGHYVLLTVFILIMVLFGSEFSVSLDGSARQFNVFREEGWTSGIVYGLFNTGGILSDILSGNLATGEEKSAQLHQQIREEGDLSKSLGRRKGVLAEIANGIASGSILVSIGTMLRRFTGSDMAVKWIFLGTIVICYLLYYTFLKNVYSAILRRLFLVARIYEKAAPADLLFFYRVKRWKKSSLTMLYKTVILFLWRLTIVGGIIKYYSYFCVDFIVAENPDVGAKEAVALSRRMMYGHKLDLFKLQVTLFGWMTLGFFTMGISDMAYGAAYRMSCYSEFYAWIRQLALEDELEGTQVLNDAYLFEKASRVDLADTYFDVVDEITLLHEGRVELTGIRKIAADWIGVWFGSVKSKKHYDNMEGRAHAIARLKECMTGEAYPDWLNPLWTKREIRKVGEFSPYRHYTIWTLLLMFIIFSMIGWTWEVLLHLIQTGKFVNRGTLHGPWLPIYGNGGIIVLLVCNRFRKHPLVEFLVSIVLCGGLEYYISWYLEKTYHERWWSYDGYFLNLNGRICAEGLLVFGVACCFVVYTAAPVFDYYLSKLRTRIMIAICIVIGSVFAVDYIYSKSHPNMAEGAVESKKTEAMDTSGAGTSDRSAEEQTNRDPS